MDTRYQVFLSSTYEDLTQERLELELALYELGCIPTGLNGLQDRDDKTWPIIKQLINDCDFFITIVAGRYGATSPSGVSYPHREYVHALAQRKPMVAFIHEFPGALPTEKKEVDKVANLRLYEFKSLLQKQDTLLWSASHSLVAMAKVKVQQLILNHAQAGWVKQSSIKQGNVGAGDRAHPIDGLNKLNKQVSPSSPMSASANFMPPETKKSTHQQTDSPWVMEDLSLEKIDLNFEYVLSQGGFSKTVSGHIALNLDQCFTKLPFHMVTGGSDERLQRLFNAMLESMNLYKDEGLTSDCKIHQFRLDEESFKRLKAKLVEYQLIAVDQEQKSQWYLTALGSRRRLQTQVSQPGNP